jgi:hypothetical protein
MPSLKVFAKDNSLKTKLRQRLGKYYHLSACNFCFKYKDVPYKTWYFLYLVYKQIVEYDHILGNMDNSRTLD